MRLLPFSVCGSEVQAQLNCVLYFRISHRLQSRCQLGLGFHLKTQLGKGLVGLFLEGWSKGLSSSLAVGWRPPSSLAVLSPHHGSRFIKGTMRRVCQQEMSHSYEWSTHRRDLRHCCHILSVGNKSQVSPRLKRRRFLKRLNTRR